MGLANPVGLPGHGLLRPRPGLKALLGLEHPPNLIAQLGRVLVLVDRDRVLRGGAHHLLLLADDCQRAVRHARKPPAVGHLPCHPTPPPVERSAEPQPKAGLAGRSSPPPPRWAR